ncbi:MAG TPA: hypothetical protein DIT88_11190 [Planctomycetaceae bacterium]|jgi:hypothetical protein|nr:hypothetical protein [Planctomycetaceae bacterium]|tara:strand:- start:23376 stop:24416 length:1041 start_codon:yes stop_codon:yes gene_type:complete
MDMNRLSSLRVFLALVLTATTASVNAQDELSKRASWEYPAVESVKSMLHEILSELGANEAQIQSATANWTTETLPTEMLDLFVNGIASVNGDVANLVKLCQSAPDSVITSIPVILTNTDTPEVMRHNLRLYYARWLGQYRFYDESLEVIESLSTAQVVDPATLLFFQAAGYQQVLKKDECLAAVKQLLEQQEVIPQRYSRVAQLIQADLAPLKTDSLDEVARLMDDITRRLEFGRAGKRVRKEEDDVIAKLDKMIEELEKQQQQQSSSSGQGSLNPSSPAQDSMPLGGSGPGNVDQRGIGNGSGWGDLPPKERQKALQQISKELPAHFRDVIEEYFRKLARDGNDD